MSRELWFLWSSNPNTLKTQLPPSYPLSSILHNAEPLNIRTPPLQIPLSYESSPDTDPNFGNLFAGKETTAEEKNKAA